MGGVTHQPAGSSEPGAVAPPGQAVPRAPLRAGAVLELDVGEVAHGGWCVARPGGAADGEGAGLVVFVRHALPGERVRAVVTQTTARFARADATAVIAPAPQRVSPPCPYAGPGGCGGCDWQHVSLPAQRELKAQVISQQLRRIAGLALAVRVEPVPGDDGGLGWRTRVRFAVGKDGFAGLRKHRSHEIVRVTDCLIAHRLVNEAGVTRQRWPQTPWVDVAVAPGSGQRAVLGPAGGSRGRQPRFLTQRALGRDWRVAAGGFWQVHPGAADMLAGAVLAGLGPRPGERALDLFCGAGLFTWVLARAVGPGGAVSGIERDRAAVADARYNLRSVPWAAVHRGDAAEVLGRISTDGIALAVLDPPRGGAGRAAVESLCALGGLRRVCYVSCDPATLARDIAVFGRHGWRLESLRGFDAFPMTHHVECVAILVRAGD